MCEHERVGKATLEARLDRERLEELLLIAEKTFANPNNPSFPVELLEIPDWIRRCLPHSGLVETFPLWNCVESLNTDKHLLKISKRLKALVENAAKLPRGPFVRLVWDYKNRKLAPGMKLLLIELDSLVYRAEESLDGEKVDPAYRWRELPDDLARFIPLLQHTLSPEYRSLIGPCPLAPSPDDAKKWAFTAFLDLIWQVHDWNKRYFVPLQSLAKLLAELHNEEFDKMLGRIIYSPGPTVEKFVAYTKRRKIAEAKRRKRAAAGGTNREFTEARDERALLLKGTL